MEEQIWYTVLTTHESGLKVESRRFGYESVEGYIARCIDEHGPLAQAAVATPDREI